MKVIEYRVRYNGELRGPGAAISGDPSTQIVRVTARDINSGFGKALVLAKKPLGSGVRLEIGSIEFWQVV